MHISVDGREIPEQAILTELQYHPAASVDEAREAATRALVVRDLLLAEARRLGLEVDPAPGLEVEEGLIAALLEREVHTPEPDEATCRRYYEANRRRFRTEDLFEVSHILVPLDPEAPARLARDQAQDRAEGLIAELQAHPGRFAELASAHSACPSRNTGGSLGQVGRGQTVPEFEQALRGMDSGCLSPRPVESRYGFHVVLLHHRIEGRPLAFEAVAERIAGYLRERVRRRALAQYVAVLAGRADIRGIDLAGAQGPLVQ